MARHYGTAVLPARPRKPRDKAKVEACVGIVERWLLGRLRNRIFYSLAEVNAAIAECMADLKDKRGAPVRQDAPPAVRRDRRAEPEAAAGRALGRCPVRCRVGLDYHIAIERHHYWCPTASPDVRSKRA